MSLIKTQNLKRRLRQRRIRARIFGSPEKPRLAVFRSNRSIYAQLIDDGSGKTLAAASSLEFKSSKQKKSKTEMAYIIGELIAKRALKLGIKKAVIDRRSYLYHGRVKSLAEGARNGGLQI
jgi:large subunit ribosomal protein L18